MEIDDIDLEDERTSEVLLKYLNGQIPFNEWLNLQSGNSTLNNIDGDLTNEAEEHQSIITEDHNTSEHISDANLRNVDVFESNVDDHNDVTDSSSELFHPSIAKFPKKMTELLLLGNNESTAPKSVDEFMSEIPQSGRKRRRTGRKRHNELGDAQRAIMGEANLCFVRKDFDKAWNLCEELIRKAPRCYEPFQTLAFICEEKNDPEKAHQYKLIAAHLGASDCEEWMDLAQTSIKNKNYEEALVCYHEASKKDPSNYNILISKAAMHEELGQQKRKMEVFENILKILPDDQGERYFGIAKDIAQIYHSMKQSDKAILTLEKAFKKHPDEIKFEDVNILTELHMSLRQFQKAFQVICQYCDIEFTQSEYSNSSLINVIETLTEEDLAEEKLTDIPLKVSQSLPVDLRAKMIICMIQTYTKPEQIESVSSPLFLEPVEEVGDLYLDIADAYCETGQYQNALVLLDPLVKTEQFSQAAVWLKKAECLATLRREEEAAEAYSWVITLAPGHSEARFTLAALYQRLGQTEKGLKLLDEMPGDDDEDEEEMIVDENEAETTRNNESGNKSMIIDSEGKIQPISNQELRLHYYRSLLFYAQKRWDDFSKNAIKVLSQYFSDVYYDEDMKSTNVNRSFRFAMARLRKVAEDVPNSLKGTIVCGIRQEEWWDLFLKVANVLYESKRYEEMEYIVKCAMSSARFSTIRRYQRELDYLGVTACYINGSFTTALNIIRALIIRDRGSKHLWNMFSRLVAHIGGVKHHRFSLRQLLKDPDSIPLQLINGHNALMSGSYKYALGEYFRVFRVQPNDPMVSLLIAVTYLQLACQRFPCSRNAFVIQGFLFLYQYQNLRKKCQETYYNLARGYHQLGLFSFASHYYHKVLELPILDKQQDEEFQQRNNLHREAAVNLSMIYLHSGNRDVARQLLQQYCTI